MLDRDPLTEAVPPYRSPKRKIKRADADAAAQRLYASAKSSEAKKAEKKRQYEEQIAKPFRPTLPRSSSGTPTPRNKLAEPIRREASKTLTILPRELAQREQAKLKSAQATPQGAAKKFVQRQAADLQMREKKRSALSVKSSSIPLVNALDVTRDTTFGEAVATHARNPRVNMYGKGAHVGAGVCMDGLAWTEGQLQDAIRPERREHFAQMMLAGRKSMLATAYVKGGVSATRLFRQYDKDNDNELSFQEWKTALRRDGKLDPTMMQDRDIRAAFAIVDVDGDGGIGLEEFRAFLRPAIGKEKLSPAVVARMQRQRRFVEGNSASRQEARLRKSLQSLKISELLELARADGVNESALAGVTSARSPRHAAISVVVDARNRSPAARAAKKKEELERKQNTVEGTPAHPEDFIRIMGGMPVRVYVSCPSSKSAGDRLTVTVADGRERTVEIPEGISGVGFQRVFEVLMDSDYAVDIGSDDEVESPPPPSVNEIGDNDSDLEAEEEEAKWATAQVSPKPQKGTATAARARSTSVTTMIAVVPDGITAGMMILVTTPDGRAVEKEVPEGSKPGDEFEVHIGEEMLTARERAHKEAREAASEEGATQLYYEGADGEQHQILMVSLDELVRTGEVAGNTSVWADGMEEWMDLKDAREMLQQRLEAESPKVKAVEGEDKLEVDVDVDVDPQKVKALTFCGSLKEEHQLTELKGLLKGLQEATIVEQVRPEAQEVAQAAIASQWLAICSCSISCTPIESVEGAVQTHVDSVSPFYRALVVQAVLQNVYTQMLTTRALAVIEADASFGEEEDLIATLTKEVESASLEGAASRAAAEALAQVIVRVQVKPPALAVLVAKEPVGGPIAGTVWERVADEDGELYYNSTETGETTWDAPEEVIAAEETQPAKSPRSPRPESPKPADVAAVAVEGPVAGTPWERVADEDGDLYFNHTGTGETTWDTPEEVIAAEAAQVNVAVAGSITGTVWERVADEDGDLYYNNTLTGETTWDAPEEVLEAEADAEADKPKKKEEEEPLTVEPVDADESATSAYADSAPPRSPSPPPPRSPKRKSTSSPSPFALVPIAAQSPPATKQKPPKNAADTARAERKRLAELKHNQRVEAMQKKRGATKPGVMPRPRVRRGAAKVKSPSPSRGAMSTRTRTGKPNAGHAEPSQRVRISKADALILHESVHTPTLASRRHRTAGQTQKNAKKLEQTALSAESETVAVPARRRRPADTAGCRTARQRTAEPHWSEQVVGVEVNGEGLEAIARAAKLAREGAEEVLKSPILGARGGKPSLHVQPQPVSHDSATSPGRLVEIGMQVEVYSVTVDRWEQAVVTEVEEQYCEVSLGTENGAGQNSSRKWVDLSNKDEARFSHDRGSFSTSNEPLQAVSSVRGEDIPLMPGSTVEVYSASQNTWVTAVVNSVEDDEVEVVYEGRVKWVERNDNSVLRVPDDDDDDEPSPAKSLSPKAAMTPRSRAATDHAGQTPLFYEAEDSSQQQTVLANLPALLDQGVVTDLTRVWMNGLDGWMELESAVAWAPLLVGDKAAMYMRGEAPKEEEEEEETVAEKPQADPKRATWTAAGGRRSPKAGDPAAAEGQLSFHSDASVTSLGSTGNLNALASDDSPEDATEDAKLALAREREECLYAKEQEQQDADAAVRRQEKEERDVAEAELALVEAKALGDEQKIAVAQRALEREMAAAEALEAKAKSNADAEREEASEAEAEADAAKVRWVETQAADQMVERFAGSSLGTSAGGRPLSLSLRSDASAASSEHLEHSPGTLYSMSSDYFSQSEDSPDPRMASPDSLNDRDWRCSWCTVSESETDGRCAGPDGPDTLCDMCGRNYRKSKLSRTVKPTGTNSNSTSPVGLATVDGSDIKDEEDQSFEDQRSIWVECPAHVEAGSIILVEVDGVDIEARVPHGIGPGGSFEHHLFGPTGTGLERITEGDSETSTPKASEQDGDLSSGAAEVRRWLVSNGLEAFATQLLEDGYDDLHVLRRLPESEQNTLARYELGMNTAESSQFMTGIWRLQNPDASPSKSYLRLQSTASPVLALEMAASDAEFLAAEAEAEAEPLETAAGDGDGGSVEDSVDTDS